MAHSSAGGLSVLILGGSGLAGGHIASALLASPDISVALGARSAGPLDRAAADLASKYGSDRISTAVVDATKPASLADAMDGAAIVVMAAHIKEFGAVIAQAAIDAGADVVSINASRAPHPMESLRAQAERLGRCFVTDAGLTPGLPPFLIRLAGGRLDRMETAFVAGAVSNPKGWPADTLIEIVDELAHLEPLLWRDGSWQRRRAAGVADARSFDFGPDWGRRRCSLLFTEEVRDVPQLFPSLREAGGFASMNSFVDLVALPAAFLATKLAPNKGRLPASRFLGWGMRRFARPPFGGILVVEATGELDGTPKKVRVSISHANEYEATGLVVAAYISQWADPTYPSARSPGLHPMGMIVEPEPFLLDLANRGFRIEQTPTASST
jgi:nucleotide-binding universal stress UspA family protein